MWGYLRRKVTYNLARAGRENNFPTGSVYTGESNVKEPGKRAFVIEEFGLIESDYEYCKQGELEGWMELDGWHRDEFDNLCLRYRLL